MARTAALLALTATLTPAAVLGALPVLLPVLVVLAGIALAVTAFEPVPLQVAGRAESARRAPAHRRPR